MDYVITVFVKGGKNVFLPLNRFRILKVLQERQLLRVVVYFAGRWKLIMLQHFVLKTLLKKLAFFEFSLHTDIHSNNHHLRHKSFAKTTNDC